MATPASLTPGVVLGGDFRIVQPLGSGGMGAVFVAEQLSTGARRALKVMHAELVADAAQRRRFEQEARMSARIPSDHVVQTIAAGVDPQMQMPWIAMELVQGETLAQALAKQPLLPLADVRDILSQLCAALIAADQVSVIHRDLKPENIFLAAPLRQEVRFTVKVLDFGLAKVVAGTASTTSVMGTPLWMAPEQADPNAPPTAAIDIWALGLIAFCLLCGVSFWKAAALQNAHITALMKEVLIDDIPAASQRAAELAANRRPPPGFDAWFARCVARDPRLRFPSAAEAHRVLMPLLSTAGFGQVSYQPGPGAYAESALASTRPALFPSALPAVQLPSQAQSAGLALPTAPAMVMSRQNIRASGLGRSHIAMIAGAIIGTIGLFVGVVLVLFQLGGQRGGVPSPSRTAVPTNVPPGMVPTAFLHVSLPPGKASNGAQWLGTEATREPYFLPYSEALRTCRDMGLIPCSEEAWERACEGNHDLGLLRGWTAAVEGHSKIIVRGGTDGCRARSSLPATGDRAYPVCCGGAGVVGVAGDPVDSTILAAIADLIGALQIHVNNRTAPDIGFVEDNATVFGVHARQGLEPPKLLARLYENMPDYWMVHNGCAARP